MFRVAIFLAYVQKGSRSQLEVGFSLAKEGNATTTTTPVDSRMTLAICGAAVKWGWENVASIIALGLASFLRTGELLDLRATTLQ